MKKAALWLVLSLVLLSSQPTKAWLYTVAGVIGAGVLSPVLLPTGLGGIIISGITGAVVYNMAQNDKKMVQSDEKMVQNEKKKMVQNENKKEN